MVESGVMLKIDIHTHILPPEIPQFKEIFGYGGFMQLQKTVGCSHCDMVDDSGKFFRRVEENTFNPDVRIKDYDKYADQKETFIQVLSTVPVMFSYWAKPKDGLTIAQYLNDHIIKVVADYPKRFVGLGTLPMQDPHLCVAEIERCASLGLRGFQIGSHILESNLSDEKFFPVYQALEKWNMSLFVHPWEMMGQSQMQKYWLPWLVGMPAESSRAICSMLFAGVFEKFPALRVAFAHGGGSFPATLGRIQHGFDSRPDLCAVDNKVSPRDSVGKFFVDSLVHDSKMLKYLVDVMGKENICLGSDYPFPLGEQIPGKLIKDCDFDLETEKWLYHQSALKWLNMKADFFTKL